MSTAFLLTWNPRKFDWPDENIDVHVRRFTKGQSTIVDWSCSNSTKPKRGDRAFMMKLGQQGRGIFASGWMLTSAQRIPKKDFGPMGVNVELDAFLDPRDINSLLDPSTIPGGQHWTPQNSGSSIKEASYFDLEARWTTHLAQRELALRPRQIDDGASRESLEIEAIEGAAMERLVKHLQRERSLRNAKLIKHRQQHGSLACEVCGFDFEREFGVSYAEVHHIKPLALAGGPSVTNLADLAVICANCHRVAHQERDRPKSLAKLRAMRSAILRSRSGRPSAQKST